KVLADPRRIRILELLGDEERTTKQIAEILGEPPTRLYHHVAALERVGLIRLSRTRQSRGAVEKYYVPVAKAISADPKLFASRRGTQAAQAAGTVASRMLDLTAEELRALLAQGESLESVEQQGILSYLEVRGTPREIDALRAKLSKLIESHTAARGESRRTDTAYRLTIAFFPLARRSSPPR
ncbi:MAG TPA: winged helix-turn-helix domain-containing protein, partial [Gemmatimonadaceae bacterium]|nr:winged helix-turn-helix domain-containing protein [Gemmatimonadaceae bacterium]